MMMIIAIRLQLIFIIKICQRQPSIYIYIISGCNSKIVCLQTMAMASQAPWRMKFIIISYVRVLFVFVQILYTLELKHRPTTPPKKENECPKKKSFVSFFVYGCFMVLAWMSDRKSSRTDEANLIFFCQCECVCV